MRIYLFIAFISVFLYDIYYIYYLLIYLYMYLLMYLFTYLFNYLFIRKLFLLEVMLLDWIIKLKRSIIYVLLQIVYF